MSTTNVPTAPVPRVTRASEIRIYGHSTMFYWWPMWALGYAMALVTSFSEGRALIVPKDSQVVVEMDTTRIILPQGREILTHHNEGKLAEHMHPNKNLGIIFTFALILVIMITNVPLRGLASAIMVVTVLFFVVLFLWLGVWDNILEALGKLTIHMNMGFYIFFSTVLFIVWLVITFVYDRLTYWRVTPGQITQEYVFGGGQRSFDTEGMAFEKLRDDLFRHWVLGLGSGDLIMHPLKSVAGEDMNIHNVLFVGHKLRVIQEMISKSPDTA